MFPHIKVILLLFSNCWQILPEVMMPNDPTHFLMEVIAGGAEFSIGMIISDWKLSKASMLDTSLLKWAYQIHYIKSQQLFSHKALEPTMTESW